MSGPWLTQHATRSRRSMSYTASQCQETWRNSIAYRGPAGSDLSRSASRASSRPNVGGSWKRIGPRARPSGRARVRRSRTGARLSRRRRMCVINRLALTANTKDRGTAACHARKTRAAADPPVDVAERAEQVRGLELARVLPLQLARQDVEQRLGVRAGVQVPALVAPQRLGELLGVR